MRSDNTTGRQLLVPTDDGLPNIAERLTDIDMAVRAAIEGIVPEGDYDQAVNLHGYIKSIKAMCADWSRLIEQRFLECLHAHGADGQPDEIMVGTIRYYEGATKRVTPNDTPAILDAILNSAQGDCGKLAGCLARNPFKQATVRELIGDEKHAELFTTDYVPDLKTGKPRRGLKVVDTAFLKSISAAINDGPSD
jgi:hypothetical protein